MELKTNLFAEKACNLMHQAATRVSNLRLGIRKTEDSLNMKHGVLSDALNKKWD